MVDCRGATDAVAHIGRLPSVDETIHMVAAGSYSLFDHIPAVLELVKPERLSYLAIVTLSFSARNVETLEKLMDDGQVRRLDMLYSCSSAPLNAAHATALQASRRTAGASVELANPRKNSLATDHGRRGLRYRIVGKLAEPWKHRTIGTNKQSRSTSFHAKWIDEMLSEATP